MKLYVKKIWSYNPNKYEYISLDLALKMYDAYLDYYKVEGGISENFKSFEQWLRTEISPNL